MMMRKPDKPSLRKALVSDEEAFELDLPSSRNDYSYVIDGGALLHRVCWAKGSNFKNIAKSYVQYVQKHYGKCFIVFDGYESATTKATEQQRRGNRFRKCPDVDVKDEIVVPFAQEKFLSNAINKAQLIKMLSQLLIDDGNEVINCSGDADTTICHTAINLATAGENDVVLVADDTDIFVMLIYHWTSTMKNVIFYQQKMLRGWNIASLFPRLDKLKDHILFVHAMTGCDTTSAPYGKGKKSFLNQILKSKLLQSASITMQDVWAEQNEVGEAAIRCFVTMYTGKNDDTLTSLRYVNRYFHRAKRTL